MQIVFVLSMVLSVGSFDFVVVQAKGITNLYLFTSLYVQLCFPGESNGEDAVWIPGSVWPGRY